MMINYVYCGNNPEQKSLAEGVLKYPFVKGCPIYDQDSSGDYGSKIVSGLTGKIFVQWMASISDLEKIAKPDWYFWVGQTYLNYLSKGHKPPDVKHISNCFRVQQKLFKEHGIESRVISRIGKAAEIKKSFLGFEKIRVGILDAWHWSLNHEEICNELSELKGFELLGVGQGEYKLHDKTLLDSEIKEKCPHINLCEFGLLDVDVVIAGASESNINKCLREGVSVVANPTTYALDLEQKYNCLSIVRGDWGDAVKKALSPQIINGRKQLVELTSDEQMQNVVRGYVETNKKRRRFRSLRRKKINKISVFGMFRNNEDSIGKSLSYLKINERKIGVPCSYYLYENDSDDDTPEQIKEFYRHSNGKYRSEILGNKMHAGNSRPERLRDLAIYRNKMKELCDDWSSEYSFIVDSEINFPSDIFIKMISTLESYKDCVMVTPFGTHEYDNEYYDIFAYLNDQGEKTPPSSQRISEANSAFSGFACIKTGVFEKCHWNALADVSEHIFFCDMVRQYGKIVVDPSITVTWKK